jgi:prevent-host-death family protein
MAIMVMLEEPMRSVNIADLKSRLSSYLQLVRAGEEILIRARNTPIARIVPLVFADDFEAEEKALIVSGQLRPPKRRLSTSVRRLKSGPTISPRLAVAALIADREEE